MKSGLSRVVLLAGLGLGMASWNAQAAVDWTWTLANSAGTPLTPVGSNLPGTTSVMGYSAANDSTALVATSGSGLPDLQWYSGAGYGICSTPDAPCGTAPEHAMDNNGYKEAILLTFGGTVKLGWIDIGYMSGDSDMSVLAYTGSGTPLPPTANYGNLLSNGWSLVGQYSNVPASTSTSSPSLNLSPTVSSSYWLIAAYNSVFGGTCKDAAGVACTSGDDYMKLYAVAGSTATPPPPGKVSEPAAMLLVGTGLLGLWSLRRRQGLAAA